MNMPSEERLRELLEEATVDCYGEEEEFMGQFSQGRAGILENELKFSRSRISREAAKIAKQFSFNFAASREEDREVLKLLDQLEPEFDAVAEQQSRRLVEAHERFWCADGPPALPGSHPVLPVDLLGIYILLPE